MQTRIVTIDLGPRSYDIFIGAGILYRLGDFLNEPLEGRAVFIVCDKNVGPLAERLYAILKQNGAARCELHALPAGEKTKSFSHVEKLTSWMLSQGIARGSLVIALGGGVIGDLAGFCASIVMRGVAFVQIPTTLLSQVDSSVGGKTGINTAHGKNLIGTFYQPASVVIDTDTLKTLPRRELLAGYAEIVKYGLIRDAGFFHWLEENGEQVCGLRGEPLLQAIETSVKIKGRIVTQDETESGQRALLNFGHTFGHALETAARYDGRLLHGEAVAIGMIMALDLSVRMGICDSADLERAEAHFIRMGLPTRAVNITPALNCSLEALLDIMGRDKKTVNGKMRFVLATRIGDAFISDDVPENLVQDVIVNSFGGDMKGQKGRWRSTFSLHS